MGVLNSGGDIDVGEEVVVVGVRGRGTDREQSRLGVIVPTYLISSPVRELAL